MFHIQTEDSGVRHPHVTSHLYADGGNILKTKRTSYEEHLEQGNLAEVVRALLVKQHRAMCNALRAGRFDHLWDPTARPPSDGCPPLSIPRCTPPCDDFVVEHTLDEIILRHLLAPQGDSSPASEARGVPAGSTTAR